MSAPLVLLLLATALPLRADTTDEGRQLLQEALRSYVQPFDTNWDSTAVRIAWIDLNDDRRDDAIIYLTDEDWCGSGGCTILVFEAMDEFDAQEMGAFRPAAEISLMHGPVHISQHRTNRWRDLIVRDGDGVSRVLRFDGETYPMSPGSAERLQGRQPHGTTLFADGR